MKAPSWFRLTRRPVQPDPFVVTFDVSLDVSAFQAELEKVAASIRRHAGGVREVQAMLRELGEEYRRRTEVRRAGQWARGYVMGAMDPTLDEAERDRLVRDLAREGKPDLAVAVIHGWVANR